MTDNAQAYEAEEAQPSEDISPDHGWAGIIFAAVLLCTGLVFLVQSLSIKSQAGLWPRGLAIGVVVLSAVQVVIALRERRVLGAPPAPPKQPAVPGLLGTGAARRAFTALWLLVYCIAAQIVGFGPAMLVMMPLYMWLMNYRRPVMILLVTAGSAVSMTYLFDAVANVPVWVGGL